MTEAEEKRADEMLALEFGYDKPWVCSHCGRDDGHLPKYCACGKEFDKNPKDRLSVIRIVENRIDKKIKPWFTVKGTASHNFWRVYHNDFSLLDKPKMKTELEEYILSKI